MHWPRLRTRPATRRRRSWQPNLEAVEGRQLLSAISAAYASTDGKGRDNDNKYAATADETDAYARGVQKDLGAPTSGVINVPGVAVALMASPDGTQMWGVPGSSR